MEIPAARVDIELGTPLQLCIVMPNADGFDEMRRVYHRVNDNKDIIVVSASLPALYGLYQYLSTSEGIGINTPVVIAGAGVITLGALLYQFPALRNIGFPAAGGDNFLTRNLSRAGRALWSAATYLPKAAWRNKEQIGNGLLWTAKQAAKPFALLGRVTRTVSHELAHGIPNEAKDALIGAMVSGAVYYGIQQLTYASGEPLATPTKEAE